MPSVFPRGGKLWCKVKDGGTWRNKPTPYRVGDEAKAARFAKQTQTILDARLASAEPGNAPLTVATYTDRWIDGRRKRGLLSAENEHLRLHRHVLPTLGTMKLEDVRPRHVRALVLSLREARKHAPRTILKIYGILRRLFRSAEAEELILTSPCKLEAGILPKNIDADPEWRAGAVFTRHELQRLISEPSIPEDRRLYHAMMGLGGMRPGEPLRARWRHYDPTLEPLGRLLLPKTKTDVPREVPVHATLAFLLGAWKREGWEGTYGRAPTKDDLILPNGRCKRRDDKDAQHTFMDDLENRLGMRRRRRVDLRRT